VLSDGDEMRRRAEGPHAGRRGPGVRVRRQGAWSVEARAMRGSGCTSAPSAGRRHLASERARARARSASAPTRLPSRRQQGTARQGAPRTAIRRKAHGIK
jgi:hypothetical protein